MGINLRFFVPSAHADADMAGEYCNLISTILTLDQKFYIFSKIPISGRRNLYNSQGKKFLNFVKCQVFRAPSAFLSFILVQKLYRKGFFPTYASLNQNSGYASGYLTRVFHNLNCSLLDRSL